MQENNQSKLRRPSLQGTGRDSTMRDRDVFALPATNTDFTSSTPGVLGEQQHTVLSEATVDEYYKNYAPKIPTDHWEAIGDFVRACMVDTNPSAMNTARHAIGTVTKLVHWAWQLGYELDRNVIFERFVIEEFITVGCPKTWSEGTRRNARAQLFTVGSVLIGPSANIRRLTPLGGDSPSRPYDANEIVALRSWAKSQTTPRRRRAATMLLALALGAGLKVEDLVPLRVRDIAVTDGFVVVNVTGKHPRQVTVMAEWESDLLEAISQLSPETYVFMESRKGTISTKNMINSFLSYPNGGVKPNSQRMRATWVVYHLTNATPLKLLLKAAGITTAHALVRFTVFVPEVDDVEARRILRGR
jgi:integrase